MNLCAGFHCSLVLFNAELSPVLPVGTQMVEEPQNVVLLFEEHQTQSMWFQLLEDPQNIITPVEGTSKHNYTLWRNLKKFFKLLEEPQNVVPPVGGASKQFHLLEEPQNNSTCWRGLKIIPPVGEASKQFHLLEEPQNNSTCWGSLKTWFHWVLALYMVLPVGGGTGCCFKTWFYLLRWGGGLSKHCSTCQRVLF